MVFSFGEFMCVTYTHISTHIRSLFSKKVNESKSEKNERKDETRKKN